MNIEIWRTRLAHFHAGKLSAFAAAGKMIAELKHPSLLGALDNPHTPEDIKVIFLKVGHMTHQALNGCVEIRHQQAVNEWSVIQRYPKAYDEQARLYASECPRDTSSAKAERRGRRTAMFAILEEIEDMQEELLGISDDEILDASDSLRFHLVQDRGCLADVIHGREMAIETICENAAQLLDAYERYPDVDNVKAGYQAWAKAFTERKCEEEFYARNLHSYLNLIHPAPA